MVKFFKSFNLITRMSKISFNAFFMILFDCENFICGVVSDTVDLALFADANGTSYRVFTIEIVSVDDRE